MIRFTTLFLVLVTGVHPIGVVVSNSVTSVEFVLDGRQIGIVHGAPWRINCNFGKDPLPHELVAIARDGSDKEVARTRQLVNVPRSNSEVHIVLSRSTGEAPVSARLIIGNPLFAMPEHIVVKFDGKPLEFEKPDFIPFPKYDETADHIVTAEVEFTDQSTTHSAISFSLRPSGESEKRLTAIQIEVEGDIEPTVESLKGAFQIRGSSVGVSAVERSGGRIVLVRDWGATEDLARLGVFLDQRYSYSRLIELCRATQVKDDRDLKEFLIQIVGEIPSQQETNGGKLVRSFFVSPLHRIEDSGLDWVVTHKYPRPGKMIGGKENQQVADAVTIAGLQAAGSGRPRVVVVGVGDEKADASLYSTESVKNYLRALNVPLVVWATDPAAAERWGSESIIRLPKHFTTAAYDVERMLENQWIVWIDGLHLPSNVTLHSQLEGIRIAAR